MAEAIDDEAVQPPGDDDEQEETLQARHRKEKKDLQGFLDLIYLHFFINYKVFLHFSDMNNNKKQIIAKVQALKKSATKGDKKKKKEVAEEIAKLESEIETRHKSELQEHLAVCRQFSHS